MLRLVYRVLLFVEFLDFIEDVAALFFLVQPFGELRGVYRVAEGDGELAGAREAHVRRERAPSAGRVGRDDGRAGLERHYRDAALERLEPSVLGAVPLGADEYVELGNFGK